MVLQLVKKRPVDEVKAMMAPPETTEQALQRVRSQVSAYLLVGPPWCQSLTWMSTYLGSMSNA